MRVELRLVADNLMGGRADSRLFASTLEWVRELGIQLGGRKSTGLGILRPDAARFYIAELRGDKDGLKLANPKKFCDGMGLDEFVRWLRKAS